MGVLDKITHNCEHATFLIEKRLINRLTFREQIFLRIHLIGCGVCRLYQAQTIKISQMIRKLFHDAATREARLADDVKKQMQDRIEEELNKK